MIIDATSLNEIADPEPTFRIFLLIFFLLKSHKLTFTQSSTETKSRL